MRERKEEVLSSSLFVRAIEESIQELTVQKGFLEQAIEEPYILFSRGGKNLGFKSLVNHIMDVFFYNDQTRSVHDFQLFIADLLDQYIQQWATDNGIKDELKVYVRKANTYPSLFAIYYEGRELIQFDVFEKYYGIRDKTKDAETIRAEYKSLEDEINEKITPMLELIKDYESILRDPHHYIRMHYKKKRNERSSKSKGGKVQKNGKRHNVIVLAFSKIVEHLAVWRSKGSYKEKVETLLSSTKRKVENEKSRLLRYPPMELTIQTNQKVDELRKRLIPLFEECQYRLETEKYNLY